MEKMTPLISLLFSTFLIARGFEDLDQSSIAFVILTQPTKWHEENTARLKQILEKDIPRAFIFDTVTDFRDALGAWAVWPILQSLYDRLDANEKRIQWIFLCEDGTTVTPRKLIELLRAYDPSKALFLGHALRDSNPTIIHHFAFTNGNTSKFAYPDFAGGLAISWPLLDTLANQLKGGRKPHDFTIDPKHELAMLVRDNAAGHELIDIPEFCTTATSDSCVAHFSSGDYEKCRGDQTTNEDVVFAVKTCHEYHKSRVVVVKRTWALHARNIEYFSDQEDHYIPTTTLGIDNTEKGHCAKTLAIMKHYIANHAEKQKWLVIADDDTLLSVPRLLQLLGCYDHNQSLIIGERYGYGFSSDGTSGYDYPTGGSGMVFSTPAVRQLVDGCACPTPDSPDDMILGICANGMNIPIVHSAAMHQARPEDYSEGYLKRIKPISFHKHWNNDPYLVYSQWLSEPKAQVSDEGAKNHMHSNEL